MSQTRNRIKGLLKAYQPRLAELRLPIHHRGAIDAILRCRTEAAGSSVYTCEEHGQSAELMHACHHRSCRHCSARSRHEWVEAQARRLLSCPHFHVVFTLPSEYRALWRYNRAVLSRVLFECARDTLLTVLCDDKDRGYTPGVVSALHTWGRNLTLHPHLHCLVTSGGLNNVGEWISSGSFLAPGRVLRAVYRGKVQAQLKALLASGDLRLPQGMSSADVAGQIRKAWKSPWHVRVQEQYAHGRGVMLYLSRYVRGGPIRDEQIVQIDAHQVVFRYWDYRSGRIKLHAQPTMKFLRSWLEHVPVKGSHTIRHFGLYAGASRKRRNRARSQLGMSEPEEATGQKTLAKPLKMILLCKECQQPLTLRFTRSRTILKKAFSKKGGDIPCTVAQQDEKGRLLEARAPP